MNRIVDEVVPFIRPRMPGNDLRPAADDDLIDVAPHQHVPVSMGHRRRIVVGPVPDQGQGADPAPLLLAGVVGYGRQRQQGVQIQLHPLPDGLGVPPEPGVHPFQAAALQVSVQRIDEMDPISWTEKGTA